MSQIEKKLTLGFTLGVFSRGNCLLLCWSFLSRGRFCSFDRSFLSNRRFFRSCLCYNLSNRFNLLSCDRCVVYLNKLTVAASRGVALSAFNTRISDG